MTSTSIARPSQTARNGPKFENKSKGPNTKISRMQGLFGIRDLEVIAVPNSVVYLRSGPDRRLSFGRQKHSSWRRAASQRRRSRLGMVRPERGRGRSCDGRLPAPRQRHGRVGGVHDHVSTEQDRSLRFIAPSEPGGRTVKPFDLMRPPRLAGGAPPALPSARNPRSRASRIIPCHERGHRPGVASMRRGAERRGAGLVRSSGVRAEPHGPPSSVLAREGPAGDVERTAEEPGAMPGRHGRSRTPAGGTLRRLAGDAADKGLARARWKSRGRGRI